MEDEIKKKLRGLLEGKLILGTEPEVIYLMVELGKLLEMKDYKARFKTIWFYRNWAVHPVIDKPGSIAVAKEMLEGVSRERGIGGLIIFMGMLTLIFELRKLLTEHQLPTDFLGNGGLSPVDIPSAVFIRTLSKVLMNQPLDMEKAGLDVKSIRIQNVGDLSIDAVVVFAEGSELPFSLALPSAEEIMNMDSLV